MLVFYSIGSGNYLFCNKRKKKKIEGSRKYSEMTNVIYQIQVILSNISKLIRRLNKEKGCIFKEK